ncbi:MAG: tetratricopeptide repeat protein [Bacteroidales bacterium]|nr:tetratricopeptide repeat protein [Bacteroidales bacterium]
MKVLLISVICLASIVSPAQVIPDTLIENQQSTLFAKYLKASKDEQFTLQERKVFSLKALKIAQQLNQPQATMEALSSHGYIVGQEGHYAKAYEIFNRFAELSNSVGYHSLSDFRRKAYLANVFGLLHKELGEYDKALNQYYTSLSICDSLGWSEGTTAALNNISLLYYLNGNTEKAISILDESRQIADSINYDNQLLDIYINLMDMYVEIHCFDSALYSGNKALELAIRQNTPYNRAYIEAGFGKLFLKQGNYPQAVESFTHSVALAARNGYSELQQEGLLNMANAFVNLGKPSSADSVLLIADSVDEIIRLPRLHIQLLTEKANLFKKKMDYKSAFDFQTKAIFLKDSIDSSWEKVKYAEINTLYQIKLQKQRNLDLEKSLLYNQLQIKQQRFIIIISVGFLVILSILVIMIYRKRRFELKTSQILHDQNEKINAQEKIIRVKNEENFKQELNYKNRQLTSFSLSALKQSKSLEVVSDQIKELLHQHNIKPDTRKKLEQVMHHLRPFNSQKEWDEFRSYFEAVHPSYYSNLKRIAPDLTLHELKISAYLRLGMNTKEIASITFRQVRSVESTRFRIRKKVGLTANDNLFEFLEKL